MSEVIQQYEHSPRQSWSYVVWNSGGWLTVHRFLFMAKLSAKRHSRKGETWIERA